MTSWINEHEVNPGPKHEQGFTAEYRGISKWKDDDRRNLFIYRIFVDGLCVGEELGRSAAEAVRYQTLCNPVYEYYRCFWCEERHPTKAGFEHSSCIGPLIADANELLAQHEEGDHNIVGWVPRLGGAHCTACAREVRAVPC